VEDIILCDVCEKGVHEEDAFKCSNCREDLCGECALKVGGEILCAKCAGKEPNPKLYYILSWKWTKSGSGQFLQEDFVWYAPNACGYTRYLSKAGKYTLEEAKEHEHGHGEIVVTQAIPCEIAEKWSKPVVEATAAAIKEFEACSLPTTKKEDGDRD